MKAVLVFLAKGTGPSDGTPVIMYVAPVGLEVFYLKLGNIRREGM